MKRSIFLILKLIKNLSWWSSEPNLWLTSIPLFFCCVIFLLSFRMIQLRLVIHEIIYLKRITVWRLIWYLLWIHFRMQKTMTQYWKLQEKQISITYTWSCILGPFLFHKPERICADLDKTSMGNSIRPRKSKFPFPFRNCRFISFVCSKSSIPPLPIVFGQRATSRKHDARIGEEVSESSKHELEKLTRFVTLNLYHIFLLEWTWVNWMEIAIEVVEVASFVLNDMKAFLKFANLQFPALK